MPAPPSSPAFRTLYPARDGKRPMTARDLWSIPRVGDPAPTPDGRALVVPVTTYDPDGDEGTTRLWWVPLDGGAPRALTSPEVSARHPAVSPDGKHLAFVRKPPGAAQEQLHVLPLDGGEAVCRSDLPLGVRDPRWLPDGRRVVVTAPLLVGHLTVAATRAEVERRAERPVDVHVTEDRVYRFWDRWLTTGEVPHLFLVDADTGDAHDLTPASTLWMDWMQDRGHHDVSPDGSEVVFAGSRPEGEAQFLRSSIWTAPVPGDADGGGELTCLTPDHPAHDLRPRYTPDGEGIVYGMKHDPFFYADRVRLMRCDRATGAHGEVLTDWDLSPAAWEFDAEGRLFLRAETNGRACLYRLDDTDVPSRLTEDGTVGDPVPGPDGRVHFTRQDLRSPPEVYGIDADGERLRRVTHLTDDALAEVALGEVRDVHFHGAGGESVQMFVVLPPGHAEGRAAPLVHVLHGGPHGISADAFHFRWNAQLFAAPGYVAALVNFQGSTSWGQDFAQRIQGGWGDLPFRDVMTATDLLVESGLADPDRMAAAGGSYGGYLAAWIASSTDRFRCVVNHAGVYDLLAQYASDVTQGRGRSLGGEPWDGLEGLERWSPARAAEGLGTPMLVLHGERDYRVPVTQGLACYNVLKAKGVPARLVYFADENHWVLKPRNSLVWYREVHAWLARFLEAAGGDGA